MQIFTHIIFKIKEEGYRIENKWDTVIDYLENKLIFLNYNSDL